MSKGTASLGSEGTVSHRCMKLVDMLTWAKRVGWQAFFDRFNGASDRCKTKKQYRSEEEQEGNQRARWVEEIALRVCAVLVGIVQLKGRTVYPICNPCETFGICF